MVVLLSDEVVYEVEVVIALPPFAAEYHRAEVPPVPGVTANTMDPEPHRFPSVTVGLAGTGLITAATLVRVVLSHPVMLS